MDQENPLGLGPRLLVGLGKHLLGLGQSLGHVGLGQSWGILNWVKWAGMQPCWTGREGAMGLGWDLGTISLVDLDWAPIFMKAYWLEVLKAWYAGVPVLQGSGQHEWSPDAWLGDLSGGLLAIFLNMTWMKANTWLKLTQDPKWQNKTKMTKAHSELNWLTKLNWA